MSGCDTGFDPFIEGKALYSIYGYLGVNRNASYIRVKNLDHPLTADSTRKLDAKVTLTNLSTGQTQVLQDSVVRFKGIYTHNFYTTMDITAETSYRLTVTRSDGKGIAVSTTTPNIASINVTIDESFATVSWHPVDLQSHFRYSISEHPFNLRSIENVEGYCITPCGTKIPGFCAVRPCRDLPGSARTIAVSLTEGPVYVAYKHFVPGSFEPETTVDSLNIPGGSGQFGGFYKGTLFIRSSEF